MGGDLPNELASDLLAQAKAAGFAVSETQLARWSRAGLLPRPKQQSLGRGKGTQTVFPPGTAAQLLALCAIRKQTRLMVRWGWHLWWRGFPVHKRQTASVLEQAAHTWDKTVARIRDTSAGANADFLLKDEVIDDRDRFSGARTEKKLFRQAR